jgi:hypothetical protein
MGIPRFGVIWVLPAELKPAHTATNCARFADPARKAVHSFPLRLPQSTQPHGPQKVAAPARVFLRAAQPRHSSAFAADGPFNIAHGKKRADGLLPVSALFA